MVRYASHVTHITETSFPTTEINKHCNFVIKLRLLDASATVAKIWSEIYQLIIPILQQLCFCKYPPHLQVLEQFRDSRTHVHRLVAQQFPSRVHPQYASCKYAADT